MYHNLPFPPLFTDSLIINQYFFSALTLPTFGLNYQAQGFFCDRLMSCWYFQLIWIKATEKDPSGSTLTLMSQDSDQASIAQLWLNLLSSGSDSQMQRHTRSTIVPVCSASYHITLISVYCTTHTLTITLVIASYWTSCRQWDQKSVEQLLLRFKQLVGFSSSVIQRKWKNKLSNQVLWKTNILCMF